MEIKGYSRNIISYLIIFLHKSRIQRTYSSWPEGSTWKDPEGSPAWKYLAGSQGYPGLVCLAYVPAAAVIILAALLRMLADLPG